MRKKKRVEKDNSNAWLATYGDLVTLLLCFFVLLFSFSEIDAQKFQAIIQSFQGSLGVLNGGETIAEVPPKDMEENKDDINEFKLKESEDFKKLKESIEKYASERGLYTTLRAEITEEGLLIRILDNVFFDAG